MARRVALLGSSVLLAGCALGELRLCERQLQGFQLQDAQCFCCTNNHAHPVPWLQEEKSMFRKVGFSKVTPQLSGDRRAIGL